MTVDVLRPTTAAGNPEPLTGTDRHDIPRPGGGSDRPWVRRQIRFVTAVYIVLLRLARRIGPRARPIPSAGAEILLTGTFHSDNWVRAHLAPLAQSRACARVRIVATSPVPALPKVEAVYPPRWLTQATGRVPSRLLVFAWLAISSRPHVVGAFHLLFNGLVAALLARCVGARSMYFCVGGPAEVLYGGMWSENRFFDRLKQADPVVECRLLEAVGAQHLVITMGTRAAKFFRQHGVTAPIHVVPGGIDGDRFPAAPQDREFDAILVGRLAPIKRIDIFIRAVAELATTGSRVRAVIVGDGPLRGELEALVESLGLRHHITFAGQQTDVSAWLRRSRIFVLTSESEGLALSLMEAMTSGLPGVVSHVGDLPDLVQSSVNGFLIKERDPRAFAAALRVLLHDPVTYQRFSESATSAASRYATAETVRTWDRVLNVNGRAAGERL